MIKSIEDEFAGFEVVKPAPATAKPPAGFEGFEVVSRPPAQPATAIQTPSQDEFAGFELVQPAPAQRQIMSPYLRGVSEGTIKDEAAQYERRGDLLGYAPELALAMGTQVVDFPLGMVRGLRDTTRSLLNLAIGEKNTENMVKAIYKIPVLGKIWEEEEKLVDSFGRLNQDAQALLRREAMERGGMPGAVASELTQTVQNTLMFLKTVKALGVGYGGQQGIKSTLQSAAVRSAFAAITAEDLSPKERLAALGWSMAYQSTPALSSTIGKWAQSDWIAKAADIAANAGISGLQVQRVIGDAHARAEAEGKPNLGGFYSTLELIKMFGSDAVFGMMTTAFREQGKTKAEKATERLASEIKKSVQQYEQAKAQQPTAPVEDAGKPITPPPAPNQTPDKAATPLTTEGEAGVRVDGNAADAVKAQAVDDDYRGSHRAPTGEFGEGSLDAMDRTYPADIYDADSARIYGDGADARIDAKAATIIRRMRGKPESGVTVYRAVPKGTQANIQPGDWVTPIREYAEGHGERFDEGFELIERKVKAGELFTEGNSIFEYGWQPKQPAQTAAEPVKQPAPTVKESRIVDEPKAGDEGGVLSNLAKRRPNDKPGGIRWDIQNGKIDGLKAKELYRLSGSTEAIIEINGQRFTIDDATRLKFAGIKTDWSGRRSTPSSVKTERDWNDYLAKYPKLGKEDFAKYVKEGDRYVFKGDAPTPKDAEPALTAKTPAQPEGVTAKVEDLEYFAGMMTEIGEKIKSGEIQYGKTVFEDPDWMAKNYEFGSNGPQFSRNLGAAYPAGWNKKRTKQLETAIKHIKENTPLTNIDHEVIKHAQKAAYEGFGETLEGPLENAKARGERNPEIVNEAELYNGDLVYRNGEWYKVKDIDGQKELADGATIRLDDFASVKAAVVIKPDHPDYKDAQQEYQSQLRAEKQAGGKAKKTLTQTEIPGAEDAFNLAGEDARQKMVDIETAGKERELAEAKARMDRQTPDMFGENTAAKPPTIKEIDDAVNVRARDNLMSEKGDYHVPGLRQADKITAGSMAYLVEKGEVTIDEWNTWISQARSENRFSDLDAPVRQPVPPSEKPEDIMAGIAKAFGAEQKPTEQSFNSIMDTLKKSRDADGKRISEGEIRAALESDPSTGNKGRFKDMTPTEQAAAMGIMQRMAGERGVGPGAASEDDPAFQPRMTIMKDGERVEPDTGVTGLRNSQIERERAVYGLAPAMDKIRLSDQQAWDDAMRILNENPYRGIELTNELTANPRAVSKPELAILLRHKVEVNLEHNKAAAATLKAAASGDPAAIRDANLRHEQAVQMHQQIADVIGRAATTSGQALQAYKMFSDEEFNLATMELKLKAAKGKDSISPEERAALKELTEKHKAALEKLTKRIAELEKQAQDKADDDNAKSEIEKTAREKSKREREGGKEPDLEGDREKALNTIRNKAEKGDVESLADLQDPLQKLALYFEQKDIDANDGKSTLSYEKLVELVHNEVKDIIPEAALNDVRDAISGYGQVRFPSAEPAKVALRRHKAEMLKAAPLETLQANIAKLKADGAAAAKELESTKHTGYQRDKIEARARELTRQLQLAMKEQDRMMKELGIETGDPAQRLRTALDAKKTRLQNQIDDINRALEQHKELVRNKGIPVEDDITRQLTMLRDERMAAYKEMFPDKPMSMEERIERATKAAEKRLAEWEERAALARQGIFKTDDPIEQMPETERLSLLRRETEALKAEIKSWRDLAFPKSTPEERRLKSWKTRTQKTIHEIERRIDQQDYSKRAKPEPVVLDQEGFAMKKALDEVRSKWNSMLEKERLKNRTWTQKLWDRLTEPFNFARTVLASYDLSASGRQGWMLVLGHPKTAIGAFKAQINALRSEHKAYQIEQAIVNDKNYAKMLKAKVEFTEFSGKPSKMEESFMSRFASRIPGIQASQRAYTTFLNKMRADVFNTLYRSLAKAGEPTDAELLAIGRYINMATGRGDLGKHALASQSLATIFWAPRLFLSRFQLLAGAPMYHGSARTRKLIAGEYARFLGGMAMVYALAELSGAEIEEDPRSGQFGKIRYGNTRIDPLAGLAQATTLIARIATGETKTAKGEIVALRGEKKPFTRSTVDYISQFLRSKLSPLIGTAVDIAAGENIVGEPVTPASIVKRSVVPLSFQDIYDAMIDQGIPKGTAISMLAFLGFGVQTYETAQSKKSDTAIDNKFLLQAIEDQRRRLKRAKEQSAP